VWEKQVLRARFVGVVLMAMAQLGWMTVVVVVMVVVLMKMMTTISIMMIKQSQISSPRILGRVEVKLLSRVTYCSRLFLVWNKQVLRARFVGVVLMAMAQLHGQRARDMARATKVGEKTEKTEKTGKKGVVGRDHRLWTPIESAAHGGLECTESEFKVGRWV
jgi:hypothetical protein